MRARVQVPIRIRVALVCSGLVAALVISLGAIVYLRLEADLHAAADDALLARAQELTAGTIDVASLDQAPSEVGDVFAQVLTRSGRAVATTSGVSSDPLLTPTEAAAVAGPTSFERIIPTADEPIDARLMAIPAPDGRIVVAGVSFDDQRAELDTLLSELALAGPLAMVLSGVVGWLVARAALRPVDRMRRETDAISGSDPGRRLAIPATRDEVAALGRSLNSMLDRMEATLDRERRFVADASHELRTPLANLRAELDLALRRSRTPDELVAALRSATEEADRLTRLAADLLLLAGAGGGRIPIRRTETDVASLVEDTVESFAGRATTDGIQLDATVDPAINAALDPERVRQALSDLIDNGLRYAGRGGHVSVDADRRDGTVRIAVSDTGDGFPDGFLTRAFEPFSRADQGRSRTRGGAGLGLAIVRAVAEGHGGSVAASNRPGGGARVEMRLPVGREGR